VESLRICYAIDAGSLRNKRCAIAAHQFTIAAQLIAVQSLCQIALQSPRKICAIAVESLRNCWATDAQSL
jgi:hypothetical protein